MAQRDHERMEQLKNVYIEQFKPIYQQGVNQGVFRDVDPFLAMETICYACMQWGKSDTMRERCGDVKTYENFLVDIFTKGFVK